MKKTNIIFIVFFFVMILIPILLFENGKDVSSEIDNRKLAENPLGNDKIVEDVGSLTAAVDNYVTDRIGLRNFFIRSYTILNDKLFNVMVHPTYEYGEDGYVFFKGSTGNRPDYEDFYELFIKMLVQINDYCKKRNVPFYFVFEPSKSSVMTDKINSGINYDVSWIDKFLQDVENNGITLVDNYALMKEKYEEGEQVFNKKYDAGHWNYLGAFYGVNNILSYMKKDFPKIHMNEESEFIITEEEYTSLPVSEFPIKEKTLNYIIKSKIDEFTDKYINNLKINQVYNYFKYYNNNTQKNNSPKTLVFQGSYMNGYGYKFFQNALSDYIAIHSYDNIFDFEYYFNYFKPEAVVFEVTEYALYNTYFNKEKMANFTL